MEIILASASPRRKELMQHLGVSFSVMAGDVDETIDTELPPYLICEQISLLKASAIASEVKQAGKEAIVIGADTIVVADGSILTKPKDAADAKQILSALSGKWHSVFTGVTVMNTKNAKSETFYEETKVHFLPLSQSTIDAYIQTGEYQDKAGGYGIQGKGALLIDRIDGDYFNVVGLPISKLSQVLQNEFDISCL